MGRKRLGIKERKAVGKQLTQLVQGIIKSANLGSVQKAEIKMEINEPIIVKLELNY